MKSRCCWSKASRNSRRYKQLLQMVSWDLKVLEASERWT